MRLNYCSPQCEKINFIVPEQKILVAIATVNTQMNIVLQRESPLAGGGKIREQSWRNYLSVASQCITWGKGNTLSSLP